MIRYSLPCTNEGTVLEWCNTCNGEAKHVRECDVYDKCTRGYVSNKVRSCILCAQEPNTKYVPDITQIPVIKVKGAKMSQETRRNLLAKAREARAIRRGLEQPKPPETPQARSVYNRTSDMLKISKKKQNIKWAYGITTVPKRRMNLLRDSISSLLCSGFDSPRLFIDVQEENTNISDLVKEYTTDFDSPITIRNPNVRTFGNWLLALMELYVREPHAQRYALFQDDVRACKNLRDYLDHLEMPDKVYLNLITYPQNDREKNKYALKLGIDVNTMTGWYPSNQMGKGAQGLVFNREGVLTILSHPYLLGRPQRQHGWQNLDGAISDALKRIGYTEYVHAPSLITHTGKTTTMGSEHTQEQPPIQTFRGENWDALEIVRGLS